MLPTGSEAAQPSHVVGDVETLEFERWSESEDGYVAATWTRTGTTAIDGRLVSIFNVTWSHEEVRDLLLTWRGFDEPFVRTGAMKIPAATGGDDDFYRLLVPVAPLNLPESRTERIDESTQYASHVVNLVIPGFGDGRLTRDDQAYDRDMVTRQFYEHFADEYDSIAIVAAETTLSENYVAFHGNVRNPISGLGTDVFDNSEHYGSAGVLRSVELYTDARFTAMELSHHEIGHQWVDLGGRFVLLTLDVPVGP